MTILALAPNPNQNHLLAALPTAEFERLAPHLQRVALRLGDVPCESGDALPYAYFPTTAIVSLHYVLENGSSAEVAGVGREGMVGISLFMGGLTTLTRVVVQTAGDAYRLPALPLMQEFKRSGPALHLLLRYTQALIAQIAQTAACNRHHSVLQQLCRWLLMTLDRMPTNDLIMTQELVAGMLGVRREGITEAANRLRDLGVINYRRGHITVLSRPLLDAHVCECYPVVKNEFARLLNDVRYRQVAVAA